MSRKHPVSKAKKHVLTPAERVPMRQSSDLKSKRIKKDKLKDSNR